MRYGYWLPVFGGWLRNVADEQMPPTWDYVSRLARRSEKIGYDLTLIAELNLNDIKGVDAPSLDAWSTAAALAAVTESLELMVAVRPTFHLPALLAKQAANIDRISNGRLSLNVVSSWWAEEAKKYGVQFDQHDDRYARTSEWLDIVDAAWKQDHFSYAGKYHSVQDLVLQPKPVAKPRPDDLRGRGIGSRERIDFAEVRCLRDARRFARARRRENPRYVRTPRTQESAAHAVRYRRLRHRPRHRSGSSAGASAHHRRAAERRRLPELSAVAREYAAGTARLARRIFRVESRPALRPGRHRRNKSPTASANSNAPAWTCSCCNSARKPKKWTASPKP